jgi:hypothetical protein
MSTPAREELARQLAALEGDIARMDVERMRGSLTEATVAFLDAMRKRADSIRARIDGLEVK